MIYEIRFFASFLQTQIEFPNINVTIGLALHGTDTPFQHLHTY